MNKVTVVVIIVISIFVLGFGAIIFLTKEDGAVEKKVKKTYVEKIEDDSNKVKKSEMADFTNIDIDKYLELYNGDKTSVVLIGRSGCEYCVIVEPILRNIMYKNKIDINYLSLDNFDDDAREKLLNSDKYFKDSGGVNTPMLLIVKDKKIVDYEDGLISRREYMDFLEKNNIIKDK